MTIRGSIYQGRNPYAASMFPFVDIPALAGRHGNPRPVLGYDRCRRSPGRITGPGPPRIGGGERMAAILGISAFYHDSAAALVVDGRIVAAAQEERFTRDQARPGVPGAGRSPTACARPGCRRTTWTTSRSTTSR